MKALKPQAMVVFAAAVLVVSWRLRSTALFPKHGSGTVGDGLLLRETVSKGEDITTASGRALSSDARAGDGDGVNMVAVQMESAVAIGAVLGDEGAARGLLEALRVIKESHPTLQFQAHNLEVDLTSFAHRAAEEIQGLAEKGLPTRPSTASRRLSTASYGAKTATTVLKSKLDQTLGQHDVGGTAGPPPLFTRRNTRGGRRGNLTPSMGSRGKPPAMTPPPKGRHQGKRPAMTPPPKGRHQGKRPAMTPPPKGRHQRKSPAMTKGRHQGKPPAMTPPPRGHNRRLPAMTPAEEPRTNRRLDKENHAAAVGIVSPSSVVSAAKTVVAYAGPTSLDRRVGKNDFYLRNFEYFLEHGVDGCKQSHDFVLVLTEEVAEYYAERLRSIRSTCAEDSNRKLVVIERRDTCVDMGAIYAVFERFDLSPYDSFVFLNCGVVGPKLRVAKKETKTEQPWTASFTSLLTGSVKMSGLSINCALYPHVQSMLFALDREGLRVVMNSPAVYDCGLPSAKMTARDKQEVIVRYEMGMSQAILDASYSIASVLSSEGGSMTVAPGVVTEMSDSCQDMWTEDALSALGGGKRNKPPKWEDVVFFKASRVIPREVHDEIRYNTNLLADEGGDYIYF